MNSNSFFFRGARRASSGAAFPSRSEYEGQKQQQQRQATLTSSSSDEESEVSSEQQANNNNNGTEQKVRAVRRKGGDGGAGPDAQLHELPTSKLQCGPAENSPKVGRAARGTAEVEAAANRQADTRSGGELIDLVDNNNATPPLSSSSRHRSVGQLETLLEKTEDDCPCPNPSEGSKKAPGKWSWPAFCCNDDGTCRITSGGSGSGGGSGGGVLAVYYIRPAACLLLLAVIAAWSPHFLLQGLLLPVFSLSCGWYGLDRVLLRGTWRDTGGPTFAVESLCVYGVLGELCGFLLGQSLHNVIRSLIVVLTDALLLIYRAPEADRRSPLFLPRISCLVAFIAVTRSIAYSVAFLPAAVAPALLYALGFSITSALTAGHLTMPLLLGGESSTNNRDLLRVEEGPHRPRRRSVLSSTGSTDRSLPGLAMTLSSSAPLCEVSTSSAASPASSARGRRTSLPALSGTNLHRHRHSSGSMPSYEAAVIAEAHGIITDMLANGTLLPPHIISGLRAVAGLLEQPGVTTPNSVTSSTRFRNGPFVSLSEIGSDTEESPYTGERPNVLPKRFRRSLPLSVLRRMSTSTWTTTTSATGLPTLESEPVRKRSTSFRHTPVTSPGGSRSNSPSPACSPGYRSDIAPPILPSATKQQRSYSTVIPSRGSPINARKTHQQRQTIGSINIPDIMFSKSVKFNLDSQPDLENLDAAADEDVRMAHHLAPAIRRINLTSDYESSESPSNSEYGGEHTALLHVDAGNSKPGPTRVNNDAAAADQQRQEQQPDDEEELSGLSSQDNNDSGSSSLARRYQVGDIVYDLDQLEDNQLLNQLCDWDFPIFDLYNNMGDRILSQVAYKIFSDVGLFETFKIPTQEFLNYFHTLEMGYRDKPYHNRIHAADVLHGVYYLSSQPIPGFVQVQWQDMLQSPKVPATNPTNPPPTSVGQTLPNLKMHYENASGEDDLYGIMGCNLPPLELMALYTAAAMHDYDHPGRTNAFLVATNASQAILYNDRSVLENHHAAEAWRLLLSRPEFNWLRNLEKAEFKRFRYLVIEAILATDLKRHFEIIAEFNSKANDDEAPGLDWTNETDRLMACQMCIKLSDINGPCKRKDLHLQWTYRITDEFFEQGDEELSLGLPISPYMDRKNSQLARLQESFINHLVAPLCNAYGESGMLPGRWRILEELDDFSPNEAPGSRVGSLGSHSLENSFPEEGESVFPVERVPIPRIESLLTDHLKSNHEMWVAKVKEEERLKEERAEWDSKTRTEAEVPSEP